MSRPATLPCLLACVPSWMLTALAGQQVRRLRAVPGRPDRRSRGAHPPVHGDRAAGADRDARALGQLEVRPGPGRDHDDVGLEAALVGHDPGAAVAVTLDGLQLAPEQHGDPEALHRVLHVRGHVGVERAHHLLGAIHQRRLDARAAPAPRRSPGRCSRCRGPRRAARRARPAGRAGARPRRGSARSCRTLRRQGWAGPAGARRWPGAARRRAPCAGCRSPGRSRPRSCVRTSTRVARVRSCTSSPLARCCSGVRATRRSWSSTSPATR